MNRFEKQLSDSSKRIEYEQMKDVSPVARPKIHKPISVAWYTTPAAAILGLLFGLFLQFDLPLRETEPTVVMVRDTIVNHINDTVFIESDLLANTEHRTKGEFSDTLTKRSESEEKAIKSGNVGKSILEDGIDYSKLISSIY